MLLTNILRMEGREIKGSGDRGFLKGTKMFRVRKIFVFGTLLYTIGLTAVFLSMDIYKKMSNKIDEVDHYFQTERIKRYEEILEKRVERSKKYAKLLEEDKLQ
uniref:Uncharacterized protein n=1 Tax=Octopus bimaculoides TaxID=37653 RepID=A0A0L8HVQ9_OCTBM